MAANPDFAVPSPTLPPGFSRGGVGVGSGCAGSDCGSSLDYSSDEEYFSTATSRPLTQKSGMEENRKRSRSVEKEEEEEQRREAKKKKKRLFDQKQQQEEGEGDEADDDMSNDQKSLSLSSMGVGCCETLRHHISSGCAVPLCFLFVPLFLRRSRMHYQDVGIYIRPSTDCLLND